MPECISRPVLCKRQHQRAAHEMYAIFWPNHLLGVTHPCQQATRQHLATYEYAGGTAAAAAAAAPPPTPALAPAPAAAAAATLL